MDKQDICGIHPQQRVIGLCLNKKFSLEGKSDKRVCLKCIISKCKEFSEFILYEDIEKCNPYSVEGYPFDPVARKLKSLLIEERGKEDKGKEVKEQFIFKEEIVLIEKAVNQLQSLKNQLVDFQNSFALNRSNILKQLSAQYENVFGLKELRELLSSTGCENMKDEDIESDILRHQRNDLINKFKRVEDLQEHREVSKIILSLSNGISTLIKDKLDSEFESFIHENSLLFKPQNEKTLVTQEMNSKAETIQMVKSKVPYPDALNLVLYSRESIKQEVIHYRVLFSQNQVISQDMCHFFMGVIDADLRDELGYNHEMPNICIFCFLKQKEQDFSSLTPLKVDMIVNLKQSLVQFEINELQNLSTEVKFEFKGDKEWRIFLNMCFPQQFKVLKIN